MKKHRYDFFGRYVKTFSLKLRHMGGFQLEYGAKLLILMTIISMVNIPIKEVEMVKAHVLWDLGYGLLIGWCIFWFLDGFVNHFLQGFCGREGFFSGHGMIWDLKDGIEEYGLKETIRIMKMSVSFAFLKRRYPSIRKKVEQLREQCQCNVQMPNPLHLQEFYKRRSTLLKNEGVYVKNGWKFVKKKM